MTKPLPGTVEPRSLQRLVRPALGKHTLLQHLQRICDDFNKRNPVGSEVAVLIDFRHDMLITKTRSLAQVLEGHRPVIWLENVSDYYLLTHVFPRPNAQLRDAAPAQPPQGRLSNG